MAGRVVDAGRLVQPLDALGGRGLHKHHQRSELRGAQQLQRLQGGGGGGGEDTEFHDLHTVIKLSFCRTCTCTCMYAQANFLKALQLLVYNNQCVEITRQSCEPTTGGWTHHMTVI